MKEGKLINLDDIALNGSKPPLTGVGTELMNRKKGEDTQYTEKRFRGHIFTK